MAIARHIRHAIKSDKTMSESFIQTSVNGSTELLQALPLGDGVLLLRGEQGLKLRIVPQRTERWMHPGRPPE